MAPFNQSTTHKAGAQRPCSYPQPHSVYERPRQSAPAHPHSTKQAHTLSRVDMKVRSERGEPPSSRSASLPSTLSLRACTCGGGRSGDQGRNRAADSGDRAWRS